MQLGVRLQWISNRYSTRAAVKSIKNCAFITFGVYLTFDKVIRYGPTPNELQTEKWQWSLSNLKFALPGNCPARQLLHFENQSIFDCDITRHVSYGYRLFFYLFDAKKNIGNLITSSQDDKVQTSVIWLCFKSSHCCTHSGRVNTFLLVISTDSVELFTIFV